MSTFTIPATLINPEHRERAVTAEFLVDTGATYSLLPREIVELLGLAAEEDFEALLANGEPVVYKLGEVRVRLGRRGARRARPRERAPPSNPLPRT